MPSLGRHALLRLLGVTMTLVWLFAGALALQACGGGGENPPGGCAKTEDCASEEKNKVCDLNNKKCVECISSDNCGTNGVCDLKTNTCRSGCSNDDDCKDAFPGRTGATCVSQSCVISCKVKADCQADERCSANACVPNTCTEDKQCNNGEKCDGGKCVPARKLAGKYDSCQAFEDCEEGLSCLSYKGGNANQCWLKCAGDKDCSDGERCVPEEQFADGHSVCMKAVDTESGRFSYDNGNACAEGLVSLTNGGDVSQGSCWKTCTDKCLGGRECIPHPRVEDKTAKFCFKECTADSDCPDGVKCNEYAEFKKFYCIP